MMVCPDHPRSCGANSLYHAVTVTLFGSSPLVRGQLIREIMPTLRPRIIPARAGPTAGSFSTPPRKPDHPRSCGANFWDTFYLEMGGGSSPLVRGQRMIAKISRSTYRIIPARAGPTGYRDTPSHVIADHPRSCGANCLSAINAIEHSGSSPLVRGQPCLTQRIGLIVRIIPARAGPTWAAKRVTVAKADHPRSCGANKTADMGTCALSGSSPLVRGQRRYVVNFTRNMRIIPARAGPTPEYLASLDVDADHPRSCGANSLILRGKSGLSQIKIFDYSSGIWQ